MYSKIKRFLDLILCLFAVIVFFPVFILTSVVILISSPGPVLYYSKRAGKDKKPFNFYKFRSMHVGIKKDMFVADPNRVFPFGRLIRRLKIDELPQLFNVIKGDMSIVGPRPMTVERVRELYCGKYESVSSILPGLTSAASLFDYTVGDTYQDDKAYRKEVIPIKLEMELMYVERQCFVYDVELVWRTIVAILQVLAGKRNFADQPELAEAKRRLKI